MFDIMIAYLKSFVAINLADTKKQNQVQKAVNVPIVMISRYQDINNCGVLYVL
jgi:hypothetical protein